MLICDIKNKLLEKKSQKCYMFHVTLPSRTSNCIKLCAYWGSDYKGIAWWCSAYIHSKKVQLARAFL